MNYNSLAEIFPLRYRFVIGFTIFLTLGFLDWRKKGWESSRVKEYLFLASMGILAMAYGAIHDLVTVSISPEYFILGKGLSEPHLIWKAVWMGAQASYGPGLLIAALFIIMNNPKKNFEQLSYQKLASLIFWPLCMAIGAALIFGILGRIDILKYATKLPAEVNCPSDFLMVWGIHWGSYLGGVIGGVVGIVKIYLRRRLLPKNQ